MLERDYTGPIPGWGSAEAELTKDAEAYAAEFPERWAAFQERRKREAMSSEQTFGALGIGSMTDAVEKAAGDIATSVDSVRSSIGSVAGPAKGICETVLSILTNFKNAGASGHLKIGGLSIQWDARVNQG